MMSALMGSAGEVHHLEPEEAGRTSAIVNRLACQ